MGESPSGPGGGYQGGGVYQPSAPSGPSPEQLEQERLQLEQQRQQEIEEQKKQEEREAKLKQEQFERNKQDALRNMKGASGSNLGLKEEGSADDLGLKGVRATDNLELKDIGSTEATKEAQSNLYNTQQGKPSAVFDTKGEKAPVSSQPIPMSERVRKDPRMIKEQKELRKLQAIRQKLDEERAKLAKERIGTKDPEKVSQLTKELDKVEKDYQKNLLAVSNQTQKIDKLKRTIDAEVEGSGTQDTKGGGK